MRAGSRHGYGARLAAELVLAPLAVAGVLAAVAGSVTGGAGRGSWWRRGGQADRAEALAARDAAQQAFYDLDSAQREVELAVETVRAAEEAAAVRQALAEFQDLTGRINQVNLAYFAALDAVDLEAAELPPGAAAEARRRLDQAHRELTSQQAELTSYLARLQPLVQHAEGRLVRVAPAVERARRALLAATAALDATRAAGLTAQEPAARLAALGPELTKLNEGAARHGVDQTLRRAEQVERQAGEIAAEAARLPERAGEVDRRLASLRTRVQALRTRTANVEPALSELRRGFTAECWQDLQRVPQQLAEAARTAEARLDEAARARAEQRWADATATLGAVRALLETADGSAQAVADRLRRLTEVARDPSAELERARFAVRDAQRLAMAGRSTPDPRHADPLDAAVLRLDRAQAALGSAGRHPDYWHYLGELDAARRSAAEVVEMIRAQAR
ncbi:hypothetical protein [Kitasatospora viridis]|uniref:Uncharacterized protein n=1 Tax=Kitasatospora viridis TaxID=281105 RepID=A0A561ULJ9_9ACTN|nr:hypothetical protein [Kitasatospora viridis]TWG00230.1 hypothetical protein FHX73_114102 [Kitasatospora viridis]